MNFMRSIFAFSLLLIMTYSTSSLAQDTVRIATFNVSMDSSNHLPNDALPNTYESVLPKVLQENNPQIRGIAEIIQRVRPDIILLNEFDYVPREQGIDVFLNNYLGESQNSLEPIAYPYVYTAPVNTGSPSAFDLNRDGKATGRGNDAWGFGWYPGQYGMVILSKYPILEDDVRTFQHFLWKDMPGHHVPYVHDENGKPTNEPWYNDETMAQYPLSPSYRTQAIPRPETTPVRLAPVRGEGRVSQSATRAAACSTSINRGSRRWRNRYSTGSA